MYGNFPELTAVKILVVRVFVKDGAFSLKDTIVRTRSQYDLRIHFYKGNFSAIRATLVTVVSFLTAAEDLDDVLAWHSRFESARKVYTR